MMTLYEELLAGGETALRNLVEISQQENVQLDFKRKSDPSHGSLNDDDKRTLGEALSGFSNSAGGLLIWGIDARKGNDGVDCAQSLQPIAEIKGFHSHVQNLVGQFVMPRLDGVQLFLIESSERPGYGYLVVKVERSERRPHRSEVRGKRSYYKRVGDSFFEMEHYDIEDAFARNSIPELRPYIAFETGMSVRGGNSRTIVHLLIRLENESSTTARFPYLHAKKPAHAAVDRQSPSSYKVTIEDDWYQFSGGADHVINPGMSAAVGLVKLEVVDYPFAANRQKINGVDSGQFNIELELKFGCENNRMKECVIGVDALEILRYAV